MAAYFHRLSLTGLSANVVIVPLMSLVVPVGFVAIFTGWGLTAAAASWLLTASQRVAEWHMRFEPGWRIPDPPVWLGVGFAGALLAVALLNRRGAEAQRKLGLALVVALVAIIVWHPFPPQVEPGVLELAAIDVGQAESLFLVFPEGKLMVLDGGGIPIFGRRTRPRLDIGEDVVSPYLWSRSIRRLDVLAVSHAHEDHLGGIGALLDNFHPKELWTGAMPEADPAWAAVRAKALRQGVRIVPLRQGRRFSYGGAQVEVLAPAADYQPGPQPQNNDSLVLRLSYGAHSFLLTGDIDRRLESELIAQGLVRRAEVLKIAHHGGRSSTSAPLLELVRPALAVISAGFENSYNNPHPEVLQRLKERHVMVLRTDLSGLVRVRSDGRRIQAF
jgi:competence protein ComEC